MPPDPVDTLIRQLEEVAGKLSYGQALQWETGGEIVLEGARQLAVCRDRADRLEEALQEIADGPINHASSIARSALAGGEEQDALS